MNSQLLLISLSSIGLLTLIPPLAWHIKCRNIPASVLIFWLILSTLKALVDASIWGGEDFERKWDGKVWCDIMVRIQQGTDSGVVCAISAIALNLFLILSLNDWTIAWFEKTKKKICIELSICLPTPAFIIATNYIILSNRYVILRYSGCQAVYSKTWLVILLFSMWPLIWSIIAVILSAMTIFRYFQRRKDVKDILKTTESGLNFRRFARLLIFCILILLVMLPLSIYFFVTDVGYYTESFQWSDVHSPLIWKMIWYFDIDVVYDRYIICGLDYLTFLVFGLGHEAIGMYKDFLRVIGLGFVLDKLNESYFTKKVEEDESFEMSSLPTQSVAPSDEGITFSRAYNSTVPLTSFHQDSAYYYMQELNDEFEWEGDEEFYQNYLRDNNLEEDEYQYTLSRTYSFKEDKII